MSVENMGVRLCRLAFTVLICLASLQLSLANNVRVVGDILVDPFKVTSGGIASVEFTLEWDNSWRDDYNNDAVYFFLKYQFGKDGVWHHAYLADVGHTVGNGYECTLVKSGTKANTNEGVFIQRKINGTGRATVSVNLKWDITANEAQPLTKSSFNSAEGVYCSGMGIEMVFVPRGPFRIGDNYSANTLKQQVTPFPDKYNLLEPGKYFVYSDEPVNESYPPANAINKVNDITSSLSNSWVGNGSTLQQWLVDLCHGPDGVTPVDGAKPKTIKYVAVAGVPGYIPAQWHLDGSDNRVIAGNWNNVYPGESGTSEKWDSTLLRVYPLRQALKVKNPGAYCFYRIMIDNMVPSSNAPIIKSIALTDQDLEALLDYSFLVDRPTTSLDPVWGMSAEDGDTWTGTTPATYPNGYKGFYAMKYEISQEQYVEFLNKLTYAGQKNRTVGSALDGMEEGEFVFGPRRDAPAVRNGIMIASRNGGEDKPYLFACNLNADKSHSQDGDGQCVACNYLTLEDMLAYAQWTGLRPLSEMEYEKMSRKPYPAVPLKGEYAWNTDHIVLAGDIQQEGKKDESVGRGNANIGGNLPGPLRCGVFAKSGSKQDVSGAGYWGIMDLCGNLAEMYYNVNTPGRAFRGDNAAHGSGELTADGSSGREALWPKNVGAVGLRGGSFQSGKTVSTTSDRTSAKGYFRTTSDRDSTVGFRLGHTAAEVSLGNILTVPNGKTTQIGMVRDTTCSSMDYKIRGDKQTGDSPYYLYIWYVSENEGRGWDILEGESGQHLTVRNLKNTGMENNVLKNYWYKRKVITPYGDGESNVVAVSVVDDKYIVDRFRDTITVFDETHGIKITTRQNAVFAWSIMSTGQQLTPKNQSAQYSFLYPQRGDFIASSDKNLFGAKVVELKVNIRGKCIHNETIELYFPDATDKNAIGIIKDPTYGYHMWDDGSYARSAMGYRNPEPPYRYIGKAESGVYRIDPDGPSGPVEPFDVYCDMETDGGGWMLAGKFSNNDAKRWCADQAFWMDERLLGSYTDIATFADAKTPAWVLCPVNQMMFQTMRVSTKAFVTDSLNTRKTLSDYFKGAFYNGSQKTFPNTGSGSCYQQLGISFVNSGPGDFPWINADGFQAKTISIAKCDVGDTQGVISGYSCGTGEADYGLGSMEDAVFNTSSNQSDVGSGGSGADPIYNVLLFVR